MSSVHKLNPERERPDAAPFAVGLSFQHDLCDLADAVVKTRAIQAFESAAARYPIYRYIQRAVRRRLPDVMDDLALDMGLAAHRLNLWSMLLDGPGAFVYVEGRRKAEYSSLFFSVWADTKARAEEVQSSIVRVLGTALVREQMFTIDWQFMTARGNLTSVRFEEIFQDELLDEAYRALGASVAAFVRGYLDSKELVLVLQGTPGTGKTRLVRAILAEISRRKGESAEVMYTGDKRALENDEIFVDFITGTHDAFVIEDADHLLMARTDGNHDLHRFLAIADGVARAQGRKIIFTTNIPNIRDIDEALLRPGRCYNVVRTRALDRDEAERLVWRLCSGDESKQADVLGRLDSPGTKTFSIADVYKAMSV